MSRFAERSLRSKKKKTAISNSSYCELGPPVSKGTYLLTTVFLFRCKSQFISVALPLLYSSFEWTISIHSHTNTRFHRAKEISEEYSMCYCLLIQPFVTCVHFSATWSHRNVKTNVYCLAKMQIAMRSCGILLKTFNTKMLIPTPL